MKIYISADMEGVTGVTHSQDVIPGRSQYEHFRGLLTADVNAAIEGAAQAGAAGCLAAYLLEHSYLGPDSIDVRVEQGYEIGRPSLLYLQAARDGDEIRVDVGGKVQMVAKGVLVLAGSNLEKVTTK
jgi:predicted PhzF superfamily epimerase YddE/YHI9